MTDRATSLLRSAIGWRLSRHAREGCLRRGVSIREVLLAVVDFEQSYTCENYGPGRQMRQRGRLAVVVVPENKVVLTVLLRTAEPWNDDQFRHAMGRVS